jgi:hypothetical protein
MFPAERDPGSITLDDQVFRLFEFERLLNEGASTYTQANSRSL